jgi:hypothetical protein
MFTNKSADKRSILVAYDTASITPKSLSFYAAYV